MNHILMIPLTSSLWHSGLFRNTLCSIWSPPKWKYSCFSLFIDDNLLHQNICLEKLQCKDRCIPEKYTSEKCKPKKKKMCPGSKGRKEKNRTQKWWSIVQESAYAMFHKKRQQIVVKLLQKYTSCNPEQETNRCWKGSTGNKMCCYLSQKCTVSWSDFDWGGNRTKFYIWIFFTFSSGWNVVAATREVWVLCVRTLD